MLENDEQRADLVWKTIAQSIARYLESDRQGT
jgi:hypothetical protein